MKRWDRGRKKREKGNRMEWRRETRRRRGWWMSRGDGTEKKAKRKGKQLRARRKWRRSKTGREAGLGLGGQLHHPRPHGLKAHLPRSGVLGLIVLHLEEKNTPSTYKSRTPFVYVVGSTHPGMDPRYQRNCGQAGLKPEMPMAQLLMFTGRSINLSFILPKFSMTEKDNRIPPLKRTGFTLLF